MSIATDALPGGSSCIRRVALNLEKSLLQVGAVDGVYVVIEDVPSGIRLTAGRCNGNDTWSLAPGELDGLQAILPPDRIEPFLMSVRILTPDPHGYDYASTAAKFELIVCPDRESAVAISGRDAVGAPAWPRPRPVQHSPERDSTADDRRLAAARAEWQVEEEVRLARARAYWESTEQERWLTRESELRAQFCIELAEAEARSARQEASRVSAVEARWVARHATSQARWRAREDQQWCAAMPGGSPEQRPLRRFVARL